MEPELNLEQETEWIKLGQDKYEVVPQPLPYLKHKLGPLFDQLADVDVEAEGLGAFITQNSHRILSIFLPELMPLHTWEGYRDAAAMEAGDFEESYMRQVAPNGPQVRLALSVCLKVNGLDLVTQIGKLVDPTELRRLATKYLVQVIEPALSSGPKSLTSSSAPTQASASATSSTPSSPTEQPTETAAASA